MRREPAGSLPITFLRLLDPALLLLMWGCVCWAFGWRIACVAAVYWGTNYAAPFGWTGGGTLRQDWLACSVIGIALLRLCRTASAGCLLGLATLVPLSALGTGGFRSWSDFARNSRLHLDTPLANHVGLKTVLSYDREERTERARRVPGRAHGAMEAGTPRAKTRRLDLPIAPRAPAR